MKCPNCDFDLNELKKDDLPLDFYTCPLCGGMFVGGMNSEKFKMSGRTLRTPPAFKPSPKECPNCYTEMNVSELESLSFEACPSCKGEWFEMATMPRAKDGKSKFDVILDMIAPPNEDEKKYKIRINPLLAGRRPTDLYGIREDVDFY